MRKRPGRHRARNFARAVDGSASPHPSVNRLVSLANALRGAPLRKVSPGGDVRQQLMAEAATTRPAARRSFWTALWEDWLDRIRFQRGLASTTVLCTVLIAVAGIGFGTTESLPGDTLYSMKLRSESVQLAFLGSDEQRGKKNLQFANSRLDEISRLVRHKGDWPTTSQSGKPDSDAVEDLINRTFDTMDASTAAGAKAMRKAFERTGDTSPLAYLDRFTDSQQDALRDIIPSLPSGSMASATDSLSYVGELGEETAKILGTGCDDRADCGDRSGTSAANSPTATDGPSSRSPSSSATSPTASDTDSSTSAVPPSTSSGTGTGTETGTDTGSPSDTDSSTGSGSSTSSPSTSSGSTTDTEDPSESSPTTSPSPSTTPPKPTGVPSDPDDSTSTKSGDTSSDASGENSRQSAPPEENGKEPEQSADDTEQSAAPDGDSGSSPADGDAESTDG